MRSILPFSLALMLAIAMRSPAASAQQPNLEVSLSLERPVVALGEPVTFTVRIRNLSRETVTVPFATSQRFDLVIASDAGEVTRWSSGRVFAQVFRQESWLPGETIAHTDSWLPIPPFTPSVLGVAQSTPISPGLYRIWAELPIIGRPPASTPQGLIVGRPIQLAIGCTTLVSTLPGTAWLPLLPALVQPPGGLASVWRYNAVENDFTAYNPSAAALSDLTVVQPGDLLMFCAITETLLYLPW